MRLWVTGLNHKTAPVAVRETLAFGPNEVADALATLCEECRASEGLILSTCNRVEIAVATDDPHDPRPNIESFLSRYQRNGHESLSPYLYGLEGREAVRHLFRVAASLDSMVVGEPQILGQLKQAYSMAKSAGTLNGFLETVITRAFNVAKRVRTETEIGASAVSVSYAAVELAREIFGGLKNHKVLLIGAGKMSDLAARHLRRNGAQIWVTNRTRSRAEQMAEVFQGKVIDYDQLHSILPEMDIVITSSGAPHYVLTVVQMKQVIHARKNRPMFLIDIAVPRNIEPAVNKIDNVFLYDIDDLQKVVQNNKKERVVEAEEADRIVEEELEKLQDWMRTREVVPVIVSLQTQLEQLRAAEFERLRKKLGNLTPEQEEAVEALTKSIINKVAHGPIAELRASASAPLALPVPEVIKRAFRLKENS
jgi:glutamyl-tRNA reductase